MANRMNFCVELFIFSFVILCAQRHSFALEGLEYSIDNPSRLDDISVIELGSRFRRQVISDTSDTTGGPNDATVQNPDVTTVPTTTVTPSPPLFPEEYNVQHDDHQYYTSHMFKAKNIDDYWIELDNALNHDALSNSYRTAATAKLPFNFTFYGHPIDSVTIATGGFLYMSPFLHQWLTATQYIAPLMANFDLGVGNSSDIFYKGFEKKFIVEWRNVHLQDQKESGSFQFQTILHENGSIYFVYKKLPVAVYNISSKLHPVKIGLSDAFYFDTDSSGVKRRTIYEYHRVSVNQTQIEEGTIVAMLPRYTCNRATDCESCIANQKPFKCKWCGIARRCSDGVDWHRQDWLDQKCLQYATSNNCTHVVTAHPNTTTVTTTAHPNTTVTVATITTTVHPNTTVATITTTVHPHTAVVTITITNETILSTIKCFLAGNNNCSLIPTALPPTKQKEAPSSTIAVVIVVVVIIVVLLGALGGWFYYAYSHPTSASGMWLIEHRPSQMKAKLNTMKFWKKSGNTGDKYAVESTA